MSISSFMPPAAIERPPGKPPILRVGRPDDAVRWASLHRSALRAAVTEHGALLVRGLGLDSAMQVETVFRELGTLIVEREAFAARARRGEYMYSASKWPPSQPMCMHHELSYTLLCPSLMLLACLQAPATGGATLLADAAAVLQALPVDLVTRFESSGWELVRNYRDEIGISMADSFGAADRSVVEDYCRGHAIDFEWQSDGVLRTSQRRQAIVRHPHSGQRCWFNQIAFLNEWTMADDLHDYLIDIYGADGLPFNTRFGNGDAIDASVTRQINAAYDAHTVSEPWQKGDLLLIDNIRTAHGRERYGGNREVLVALADTVQMLATAGLGEI